ncbi:uncharacterized protein LOC62_08G009837 [Vanrija pseudolonga]|uniref:Protein CPL1-like domain-containing protein n=1 Tax=Vanrija pseudolonga TaxID=143232 RepID=A0AAF0YGT6_9TREE|nr:hypothetical protein LOC62_08G009837 [Vanrija pseudolonga]
MLAFPVALLTVFAGSVLAQAPPGFTSQSGPPTFLGCYAAATPQSTVQPGLFTFLGCSYWDSTTSFVSGYSTCYAQPSVNIPLGSYKVITTPVDCYIQCATSTYAYVYANIAFNQWNCFCSNSYLVPGGTSFQGCQQGSVFVFAHSLQAAASGFARRKRVLADPNAYCPGALSACKVANSSEGYECLDTRSELESCGGCVNGYFDNSTQPLGLNCDTLSTHDQQYTCVEGQCQPFW